MAKRTIERKFASVADFMASRPPYRSYTANQIVQHTGFSFTTVRQQLRKLEEELKIGRDWDMGMYGRMVNRWYWLGD